jgi:hypothetical protein
MLGDIKELRNSSDPQSFASASKLLSTVGSLSEEKLPLRPASLLIIDRCEDLFTPCAYRLSESTPICQRITGTLYGSITSPENQAAPVQHPSIQHPSMRLQSSIINGEADDKENDEDSLMTTFSALSALPLPLDPIVIPSGEIFSSPIVQKICNSLATESEEKTRVELLNALQELIKAEHGVVPTQSKKRGYGAEVLVYVQAFLVCPGNEASRTKVPAAIINRLGYNPKICLKHKLLLQIAYAVIEAMQRSSAKQYAQRCAWKLSYEAIASKEQLLMSTIQKYFAATNNLVLPDNADFIMQQQISLSFYDSMRYLHQTSSQQQPLDVCFVLLQIIR